MITLLYKYWGEKFKEVIRVCAEAVAYVLVVCVTITGHLGPYVSGNGYDVSYPVMVRLVFFGSLISLIAVYIVIGYLKNKPQIGLSQFVRTLVFLGFSLGSLYCLYNLMVGRTGHFGFDILAPPYVAFYIYGYSTYLSNLFSIKVVRSTLLIGLVFASIILPVLTGKVVNLESYVELNELSSLRASLHKKIDQPDSRLVIALDDDALAVVEENIEKIVSSKNKYVIGSFDFSKSAATFIFNINKNNLQPACLLGKYDLPGKKIATLDLCLASFVGAAEAPELALKILMADVPFVNKDIAIEVIGRVNRAYLNNIEYRNTDMLKARASVMLVRGAYFHHYNSIARSINGPAKISEFFSNQYGFGPLIVVKSAAVALGLPAFDAIYVATIAVNFLVLVFVFFLFRRWKVAAAIWLGFSVSVLCTYFLSNMMAPFLYYIRYLPSVALFFLLFNKHAVGCRSAGAGAGAGGGANLWRIVFVALLLLASIYNFEYAVLTALGVMMGGFLGRRLFYVVSGLLSILVAVVFKLYFSDPSIIGTNYLSYISGAGIDGGLSVIVYLFVAAVLITSYLIIRANEDFRRDGGVVVAAMIFLMLCTKVAWIGSANHIGPLFLLLMIIYGRVYELQTDCSLPVKTKLNYCIFVLYAGILVISMAVYGYFHYNSKLYSVKYVRTDMSLIFKVPAQLAAKLQSAASIYSAGDLVLSPIDNALSLSLKTQVTAPYPDISTNINSQIDLSRVVAAYTDKKVVRVMVDKSVVDAPYLLTEYSDVLFDALNLGYSVRLYSENVLQIFKVYQALLQNGFSKCSENENFIILCR